jgi:hypothetical protein
MTLLVVLTVRDGAADAFRIYERAAAAIMARHGGVIDRVVAIPPAPEDAASILREVHLVRFPSARAFAAYRDDPALAALGPQRAQTTAATEILVGEDRPRYGAPGDDGPQTFTGGCHCCAVRFRVTGDLRTVTECNCSVCTQKGFLHLIVPASAFELLSGRDSLTSYQFNTGVAQHTFCRVCGIHPFYAPRSDPDKIDVNVRCLHNVDPRQVTASLFDGRHWERAIEEPLSWR